MKKTLLTVITILIIGITSMQSQEKKINFNWDISTSLNKSFQTITSDMTLDITEKIYLSNWSSYSTKGTQVGELPYSVSLSFINYKTADNFILSFGVRHFKMEDMDFESEYFTIKATLKLF